MDFFKIIFQLFSMFFAQHASAQPVQSKNEPIKDDKKTENKQIDWNDPACKVSKYFTVKEAIWLPEWKRLGNLPEDQLTDEVKTNLIKTFQWMDDVREYVGKPIRVHLAFRSMAYHLDLYKRLNEKRTVNKQPLLNIPMRSAHLMGQAVDFSVSGITCDEFKEMVLEDKMLEEWNLRMEDNGKGANWIHLDDKKPGITGRFFKP